MFNFFHVWHAENGMPDSSDAAVRISNALVGKTEAVWRKGLRELIAETVQTYPEARVCPAPLIEEDEEEKEPILFQDRNWSENPAAAYQAQPPKCLLICLPASPATFFPSLYDAIKLCADRGLVLAEAGLNWGNAYWLPNGIQAHHDSVLQNNAEQYGSGLSTILDTKNQSAAVKPDWQTVAEAIDAVVQAEGFRPCMSLGLIRHDSLSVEYVRRLEFGEQEIAWRLSTSDTAPFLDFRMSVSGSFDVLFSSSWEMDIQLASNHIFDCEMQDFITESQPDLTAATAQGENVGVYFANRVQSSVGTEKRFVDTPEKITDMVDCLSGKILPFLNACKTPLSTLKELQQSPYPCFRKTKGLSLLPFLILAWHGRQLNVYREKKETFVAALSAIGLSEKARQHYMEGLS